MRKLVFSTLLGMCVFTSCVKNTKQEVVNENDKVISPNGFNYETTKKVSLNLTLKSGDDKGVEGVIVNFYSSDKLTDPLFSAVTDAQGKIVGSVNIPAYCDTIVVDPAYVGLMRNAVAVVRNNSLNAVIGGKNGYSGDIIENRNNLGGSLVKGMGIQGNTTYLGTNSVIYQYMGAHDDNGRPTYLVQPGDVISTSLTKFINSSLPEKVGLPVSHPEYLIANNTTTHNIEKLADVWVTFVHEGAGFFNTLGYYTYPTNNPPKSAADIDTIKYVFPNASFAGSGGGMISGDKVFLGRFPEGVSVAFVLVRNAWDPVNKKVNSGSVKYYANDAFNSEAEGFKRHAIVLYDDVNKLFLNGFEDQQRDNGSSDQDFNDLVFYVTSNPVEAISRDGVPGVDGCADKDGDGVTDCTDKFPDDPKRAYITYYPDENTYGTLAYEDLWPNAGDYDLNDLVVGYRYKFIKNSVNNTIDLEGRYVINAAGASRTNGFGVQLSVAYNKVSSIKGQKLTGSSITLNTNGTEAGQAKAVFFPFDNQAALVTPSFYLNTMAGRTYVKSDTATVSITFTQALTQAELGDAPFNPFLVVNQDRRYEVHLPGLPPTDKADPKLFGTGDDQTNLVTKVYYKTKKGWPYALHVSEAFEYPYESKMISSAYPFFLTWAGSGGKQYTNWYKNLNGYRNSSLIYKK